MPGKLPPLRIYGTPESSPLGHLFDDHASGRRKVRALVEYQTDPLGFLVDVLHIPRQTLVWSENPGYESHEWDGTVDPLVRACDVLAGKVDGKKHVAIEAATGTQKTYTAAGLVLWFLACFEDSLVVTTAPVEKQLKENLWKEIAAHLPAFRRRFPRMQSIDLKIRMRPTIADPVSGTETRQEKWSAVGWCAGVDAGSESAVRSQGFHAAHMLIVVEEFPGMDPAVVTALKNTAVAPHNIILGLGNPDNQLDPLHQFSELPAVEAIRISAYDHPNVVTGDATRITGATSQGFIDEKRDEYGEDGPLYLSRVRGLSPKESHDALIRHADLVEAARKWDAIMGRTPEGKPCEIDHELRQRFMAGGRKALGCDPANTPNGDRFTWSKWTGAVMTAIEKVQCQDSYEFGERIVALAQAEHIAAQNIGIDNVGVGSGTVNLVRRKLKDGLRVQALEGGADDPVENVARTDQLTAESPTGYRLDSNRFANKRTQMAWGLREKLRRGTVAIPRHAQLWRELLAIRYTTEGGVVQLERKAKIAKRLGCSPDYSDAAMYGDHVREPLPMEQEDARPATGHERDRSRLRIAEGVERIARRKSPAEELDDVFAHEARAQWRGGRPARWNR